MNKTTTVCVVLAAFLCSVSSSGYSALAEAALPLAGSAAVAPTEELQGADCPGRRLPLPAFYWQSASTHYSWQATDQQIGWQRTAMPLQLAELAETELTEPAQPVRWQSWPQHEQLVWQLPNGWLHAGRVAGEQLTRLWQVQLPANPSWLPAPLTILPVPLANQQTAVPLLPGHSAGLLLSAGRGQAVQWVDLQDGRTSPIRTPDRAGAAVANPLAFDSDLDGDIDRIYFVSALQQIWRLDWQQGSAWQARLVARLDVRAVADATLQGWQTYWPVTEPATDAVVLQSKTASSDQAIAADGQPAAKLSTATGLPATQRGELLLMLTRQTDGFGILLIKVAAKPGPVIDVDVNTAQPDDYWFIRFRERPVSLPVVVGSVLYLPLTRQAQCPLPAGYQQLLAVNLLNGAAVYGQQQLTFRQPQTTGLQLDSTTAGYVLGTETETIIPQVVVVEPQCQFCLRPLTAETLASRRWLAGYLTEEAF